MIGAKLGLNYSNLSAIEFAVGFGVAVMLQRDKKDDRNKSKPE